MGFDAGQTYQTRVLNPQERADDDPSHIEGLFRKFIFDFRVGNRYIYRDQLRSNVLVGQYYLTVDMSDVVSFNEDLAHGLKNEPATMIPLFESAVGSVAQKIIMLPSGDQSEADSQLPRFQLLLKSDANISAIRDLNATCISKLVSIAGIIIGASTLSSKAIRLRARCKGCQNVIYVNVDGGFTGISLPSECPGSEKDGADKDSCPKNPFVIDHENSEFVDQQVLKLQEAPDMVPVGELPRHILLCADRYLANKVIPGNRCTVMGVYSIYNSQARKSRDTDAVALRNPYLHIVGLTVETDHNAVGRAMFSEEEEEEFTNLSRNPNLYQMFSNSIAPSIYGNSDIKKAITCLLLGGSKRILPDGMRLRGDINILLLGDPGTAKSQLLKFVEKVAPIAIYTSGKGSSAAGLTASVQRDPQTRDFYLEGGAMVLADGGVVCIDEFDKMREDDRVAIHEAMEQQTISIAKAGITTILNSRTSVLAAANPVFGRYDEMKSPGENIDFQSTILSRFDMIFLVKDEHNRERDQDIARHVVNIHMNRDKASDNDTAEIPIDKMRRYIAYCRTKCAPRLSPEASEKLSSQFVSIRKQVRLVEEEQAQRSSIPITVRQLEAIIRITEALAKLELSPVATERHVNEAVRLFQASTMEAVHEGGDQRAVITEQVRVIEGELKRRLPMGWSTSYDTLTKEFCTYGRKYPVGCLNQALNILEKRQSIQFRRQGRSILRTGP